MSSAVTDNATDHRFELKAGDHVAVACYTLAPGIITFIHTEVPPALSGQSGARSSPRGALEQARARGLNVVPNYPFIAAFIGKNAEFAA